MHIMDVKTANKRHPKNVKKGKKKKISLVAVAAEPVQGGRAHGET